MLAQLVAVYMGGVRAALLVRHAAVEVTVREVHTNVAAATAAHGHREGAAGKA